LLPLRGSFQNLPRTAPFYMGVAPELIFTKYHRDNKSCRTSLETDRFKELDNSLNLN